MNKLIIVALLMVITNHASAQYMIKEILAKKIDARAIENSRAKILSTKNSVGGHDGNGGDPCEYKVKNIVSDIRSWLLNDQFKGIKLPARLSQDQYKKGMIEATSKVGVVSCTAETLYLKGVEKTCKNFEIEDGEAQIVCNFDRLMKTSDKESYKLVHHELAGIAGYEANNGSASSNYVISDQISDYLRNEVVTKLGVKTSSASQQNNGVPISNGERQFYSINFGLEIGRTFDTSKCTRGPSGFGYIEDLVKFSSYATKEIVNANSSLIKFVIYNPNHTTDTRIEITVLFSNDLAVIKPIKMERYATPLLRITPDGRYIRGNDLERSVNCELK